MSRIALLTLVLSLILPVNAVSDQKDMITEIAFDHVQLNDETKAKIAVIEMEHGKPLKKMGQELIQAAKDKNIRGILLIIDCPGGDAARFSSIHDLIKKIKKTKPIVGLVVGYAASGGYMWASATDYIIASSFAHVGSIGVSMTKETYKKMRRTGNVEAEVDIEMFFAGEFKDLFCDYRSKLTNSQRQFIEATLEKHYQLFLQMVAENRGLDLNECKKWAEGKLFLAPEALSLGLIDEIGTLFEAEQKLIELINIRNPMCAFSDLDYSFEEPQKN